MSLFIRIELSDGQVSDLTQLCRVFFNLAVAYFNPNNPIVLTLENVVPAHINEMKDQYGMGLGLNSMEGREAKHVAIARYSANTTFQSRWPQIIMDEYVSLTWLRERGYNVTKACYLQWTNIYSKVYKKQREFLWLWA